MAILNRTSDTYTAKSPGRRGNRPDHAEYGNASAPRRSRVKPPPAELTYAESFYYLKQMGSKTPMVFVLTDGEQIEGWIEWYDRSCLKVNRENGPNLVIQKHFIKYLYKRDDD